MKVDVRDLPAPIRRLEEARLKKLSAAVMALTDAERELLLSKFIEGVVHDH
jgi:hypothetical protein